MKIWMPVYLKIVYIPKRQQTAKAEKPVLPLAWIQTLAVIYYHICPVIYPTVE